MSALKDGSHGNCNRAPGETVAWISVMGVCVDPGPRWPPTSPAIPRTNAPASADAAAVELAASADAGALVRVIAGEVGGHRGPGSTHTPITLIHATVSAGARLQLPWDPSFNALIYVLAGAGRAGTEGRPVHDGQLVVFGRGDWFETRANDLQDSRTP